jgi:hypothetical protein
MSGTRTITGANARRERNKPQGLFCMVVLEQKRPEVLFGRLRAQPSKSITRLVLLGCGGFSGWLPCAEQWILRPSCGEVLSCLCRALSSRHSRLPVKQIRNKRAADPETVLPSSIRMKSSQQEKIHKTRPARTNPLSSQHPQSLDIGGGFGRVKAV